MKTLIAFLAILFICSSPVWAEEFLSAPMIPNGQILSKTNSKITLSYPISHDQALCFYQDKFKDNRNIRYRDWKDETYIEDDGNAPWHSIRISKTEKAGTVITITEDSWTWIIGTLTLRFAGVFVVLTILYLGMVLSGAILSRVAKHQFKTKHSAA
jgi:hypothetical protein